MLSAPSRAIKLFGTEEPVVPRRVLAAGALAAELDAGNLRYIRLGGVEALRAISFIVRDRDWGTYLPSIDNLRIEEGEQGFAISYDAVCKDARQEFRYAARIVGTRDGTLRAEATGRAVTDFVTNRTGFVVLHPIAGVSGQPVEVLHVDGAVERARFPDLVDPMCPFQSIRALTHTVLPGLGVTCRMEGDAFEMEDHRNWTDASYKTYVRPLALPWPYTIKAGETMTQSVTLTVSGTLPAAVAAGRLPVRIEVGEPAGTMPRIGLGVAPLHVETALAAADRIKPAGVQLLVCHIDPRDGHGAGEMAKFRALGEALGAELTLEAVLPCRDYRRELGELAAQAREAGARFAAVAVSPSVDLGSTLPGSKWPDAPPAAEIYAAARAAFPAAKLGGGMFSYFTELNRKRPPAELLDFVTHTSCPIVHAGDDESVMESLEALPALIASTREFSAGKPYWVGPSTIGMRQNPYGSAPMENPGNGRLAMARIDPRQRGLLGAAWNLGYAAHMARGAVDTLTLSAPVGEYGIVHCPMPFAQPWFDEAGGVFPVYHVIAGLAAAAGRQSLATVSSAGRDVQAVAYRTAGATILWLANLTGVEHEIAVDGLSGGVGRMQILDETTFERCAAGPAGFAATIRQGPIDRATLAPYAVVRLEVPA
jgi:hypothetical protein